MIEIESNPVKSKLLSAALDEFAEYGFSGARVDRIARKAGINKAMVYYHYASKENLYLQVVREHVLAKVTTFAQVIGKDKNLDETVLAAAEIYTKNLSQSRQLIQIVLRELARPHSEIIVEMAQIVRESGIPAIISSKISEGKEVGTVRDIDVRHAMASFICLNIGFFVLSPLFSRVLKVEDLGAFTQERPQAVVDLFLNGVKTR